MERPTLQARVASVAILAFVAGSLALACATGGGCATVSKDAKAAGSAAVACAKADLQPLVSDLIAGAPEGLEADLTALAAVVTVDAVKCVIAGLSAAVAPPPSILPLVAPPPTGMDRARAWAATH